MITLTKSISVVVRSSSERTARPCLAGLRGLLNERDISIIEVTPFSKAVAESLKIGMQSGTEWLFCIDADVLVGAEGVTTLLEKRETVSDQVFQIQGLVLDKFFPIYRPAGNHLYRTAYAERALDLIPEEGTSLRPETDMLNAMALQGYPWLQCDSVVGIHDFHQYYADIYRKCFLQAHKHHWLMTDAEQYWRQQAPSDPDFTVALLGALAGKLHQGKVLVDKRFLEDEARDALALKHIQEKEDLSDQSLSQEVEHILRQYDHKRFQAFQEKMFPLAHWNKVHSGLEAHSAEANTNLLWRTGDFLQRIGKKLKRMATSNPS